MPQRKHKPEEIVARLTVECMRRPILNNSSPGQAVYEPFMGVGHDADRGRDHRPRLPRH